MSSDFEQLYNSMCRPHSLWSSRVQDQSLKPVQTSVFDRIAKLGSASSSTSSTSNEAAFAVPRTRILVPVSGGIASLASAWWALNHPHVDVFFCHLVGLDQDSELTDRQLLLLTLLIVHARTVEGLPLGATFTESHRLAEMESRLLALPMPIEPYVIMDKSNPNKIGERGNRRHPLTLALMYRQILNAAQSTQCSSIVWGFFDIEKQFIQSLHAIFDNVYRHQNIFPFESRRVALKEFEDACVKSERAYSQSLLPVRVPESTSAQLKKKQKKQVLIAANEKVEPLVLQTNGAALMPDLAEYVVTCIAKNYEETMVEQEVIAAETTAEYLARHEKAASKTRLPFNWCGQCESCRPWIIARDEAYCGAKKSDSLSSQYPLMHAYEQLLASVAPRVVKKADVVVVVSKPGKRKRVTFDEEEEDVEDDDHDIYVEEEGEDDDAGGRASKNGDEEDDGVPIGPEEEEEKVDEEDEEKDETPENDDEDQDDDNQEDFDEDDDDEDDDASLADSSGEDNSARDS